MTRRHAWHNDCVRLAVFAAFAMLALPLSAGQAADAALDYRQLVRRVTEAHPEYRAMQLEVVAAEQAVTAAGAFPDPVVKVELMEIDPGSPTLFPSQVGATKYTYEQMFPLWGKRKLRSSVAESNVRVAQARTQLTLAELRGMLRLAVAEYYAARQAMRINDEVLSLLGDMQGSAQSRYANGLAAQQDVIKVQAEQTMVRVEQETLRGEDRAAQIAINALIDAQSGAPLPEPRELPGLDGLLPAYEQLDRTAGSGTPVIEAAEAAVRGRLAARDLAEREVLPDLGVGISPVQVGDNLNAWEVMFEITVPLFAGKRAMAREAGVMLSAAEEQRAAEWLRVRSEAGQAVADFMAALEQERLIEGQLLAETELNFRSALAGYQSGRVDFDTVIEAERQIRQTRLLALAAEVRQQRAAARFEQVTGLEL